MNYHSNHIRFAKGYTVANVRLPAYTAKAMSIRKLLSKQKIQKEN